jgi:hypothetical protein
MTSIRVFLDWTPRLFDALQVAQNLLALIEGF